jgi:hypothetical protein
MAIINKALGELTELGKVRKADYSAAAPFPSIVFDDFFDEAFLREVLSEFPDLSKKNDVWNFDQYNEKKLATIGEGYFGNRTKQLVHFLNSEPILHFLQELTGIQEILLPDPYFEGGGYHEIKPGGLLKVHADFNKHRVSGLDRRINLLVYLNEDWQESYGGHFELWNKDMTKAEKKILPVFNRVAIFSTTSSSYHGHPDPLTCPPDRSRKSIALYYYTNGRPKTEIVGGHNTLFVGRVGVENDITDPRFKTLRSRFKTVVRKITPPILFDLVRGAIK